MKRMRRMACAALALGLMCCFGALSEAEDPVVVRVGDISYHLSQVQAALDTDFELSELLNQKYLTEAERREQSENTLRRFVGFGLMENKLREAGRDGFTEAEEETLSAAARQKYDELWQGLYQQLQHSGQSASEEEVTRFMNDAGYTPEALLTEYKQNERRYRIVEMYCPDLVLTEDMVQAYYETQFLDPDRERYEDNIQLYEQEVLNGQKESFYTPAGYRYLRQILMDYPEEVTAKLRNEQAHVSSAGNRVAEAMQALTEAATTVEDLNDLAAPRADYDAAAGELDRARQALAEKREALTLPLIQDKLREIDERLSAGIDFRSLIDAYSDDKSEMNREAEGYPFHPESKNWPQNFIDAASALEKPGDVSAPVLTDLGIHILYYAGDVPAGAHVLTAEEQETLNASALMYYQGLELEGLMETWKDEYDIETHPELLDY